jgi:hypothetical protein
MFTIVMSKLNMPNTFYILKLVYYNGSLDDGIFLLNPFRPETS